MRWSIVYYFLLLYIYCIYTDCILIVYVYCIYIMCVYIVCILCMYILYVLCVYCICILYNRIIIVYFILLYNNIYYIIIMCTPTSSLLKFDFTIFCHILPSADLCSWYLIFPYIPYSILPNIPCNYLVMKLNAIMLHWYYTCSSAIASVPV